MESSEPAAAALPIEDAPSIGYICPLYTELAAVIASWDEYYGQQEIDEDDFHYGRIGNRKVVAVQFIYGEMGPTVASQYGWRLIQAHPSLNDSKAFRLLVGIAGGVWTQERDIRLGDAVIATSIWDWRSGKQTSRGLEATSYPKEVSKRLRRKLPSFLYDRIGLGRSIAREVDRMREKDSANNQFWLYPGEENDRLYIDNYINSPVDAGAPQERLNIVTRTIRDSEIPKVHDGLIASGNVVLKDAASREPLLEKRVNAVEMEACGVPNDFFVVRGVSDYADSHKNDAWQPYAAAVAAACARLLIDHFVATAHADISSLQRLHSSHSNRSLPEATRHMSTSSFAMHEIESALPRDTAPLRPTQSDVVLPAAVNESGSVGFTQQKALPPPLPARLDPVAVNSGEADGKVETTSDSKGETDIVPGGETSIDTGIDVVSDKGNSETKDSIHSKLTQYGDLYFSSTWKSITRVITNHAKEPPETTREKTWESPTITMFVQRTNNGFTPQCWIIINAAGTSHDTHDRVWLPLTGIRFGAIEGQLQIIYESFLTTDNPLSTACILSYGTISRVKLDFVPLDTAAESAHLFIEQLLRACRSLSPEPTLSNPASVSNAEVAYGRIKVVSSDHRNGLFIHQVDANNVHYCSLISFLVRVKFGLRVLPEYIAMNLQNMASLQYGINKMLVTDVAPGEAPPEINTIWTVMNDTYRIYRPTGTMAELLDETLSAVAGWKTINVTRGVVSSKWRDTSVTAFGSSFLSKGLNATVNKLSDQWSTYLTAWQKDDSIRFILITGTKWDTIGEDNMYDGWTIKAGRGQIFSPSDSSTKFRIGFDLDERSREGDYISFEYATYFDLPETHRLSCATNIVLDLPDAATLAKFRSSIPQRFWRDA